MVASPWRLSLLALVLLASIAEQSQATEDDVTDGELITHEDQATITGFTSRTLPALKGIHCVSYYAKTTGDGTGYLKTSLTEAASGEVISDTAHVTEIFGNEPKLVYFDVPEQKDPFQVVIQKVKDGGDDGPEIAILEAKVTDGSCLHDASCNFEKDSCGWYAMSGWSIKRPQWLSWGEREGLPAVDATYGSDEGNYVRYVVPNDEPALLVSPVIKSPVVCFRFQYAIFGGGKLLVGTEESDRNYLTVQNPDPKAKASDPKWRSEEVEIRLNDPFKITMTFSAPVSGEESKFALDQIEVVEYSCSYGSPQHVTSEIPITQDASCTFDDECSNKWVAEKDENDRQWKLKKGSKKSPPYFDHTYFDAESYFQYVYVFAKSDAVTQTVLKGPEFDRRHDVTGPNCFSFWYFMRGNQVPRLSAYYSRPGVQRDPLWTREGNQGQTWRQAFVHTPYPGPDVKGHIEFVVENTKDGYVGIDDVMVYDGPCPDHGAVCDFDQDHLCGFKSLSEGWSIQRASAVEDSTGLTTDHSTQTGSGSYIYLDQRSNPTRTILKSPLCAPTSGRCLKFYYSIANNKNKQMGIKVFLQAESEDMYMIDEVTGIGREGKWSLAEQNVRSSTNFWILFAGYVDGGVIGMDDIQLSTQPCRDSYGCDFEQGLCAWSTSLDDHSNLDWQVSAGHLIRARETGPERDVSLNNPYGQFLYLQTSSPAKPGEMAVLTSQEIRLGNCLTFYYSMPAAGTGTLSVNLTDMGDNSIPQTIWSRSGSQGGLPLWRRAVVNTEATAVSSNGVTDFQLSLIGTVGNTPGANIAVDEIMVHFERCQNVNDEETLELQCDKSDKKIKRSQICDFIQDCDLNDDEALCGSCDFGRGWCNYVEQSWGELVWEKSDLVPSSQLEEIPPREEGFLLVSRRSVKSHAPEMQADLELSQHIGPTPPSCQLHFSYFLSEEDPNDYPLKLVLRQSDEETIVFAKGRTKRFGSSLRQVEPAEAVVDLGGIDARFQIAFLGHKKVGQENEGNIAISDIEMRDCQFPPVVDSCSDTEFMCDRRSCVDASRVCDFTDDCGDQSDEMDCELRQYSLRTSFEKGFGDWTAHSSDTVTPWTIYQAKDGYDKGYQPTRDHTLKTLNGHFMYTEQLSRNQPSLLISPVMVAANEVIKCHLRLYFYLHASHEETHLRVSTRTSLFGEEKVLFNKYTSHGHFWTRADIEIEETQEPFQILISGTSYSYRPATFLAVDDISLFGCEISSDQNLPEGSKAKESSKCTGQEHRCDDGTCLPFYDVRECDFVNQCPDGSDEKNCGTCDFEYSLCGWHDESLGVLSWKARASSQEREPSTDFNKDTEGQGHYVLLKGHSAGAGKTPARLVSPVLHVTDPSCHISFAYYTSSEDSGRALKVVTKTLSHAGTEQYLEIPMANTGDIQSGQWNRKTVNLGMSMGLGRNVIIQHEYIRKQDEAVAIAIDDIKFINCREQSGLKDREAAPYVLECNFDQPNAEMDQKFCFYHPSYLEGSYFWHHDWAFDANQKRIKAAVAGAWDGSEVGHTAYLTSDWINGTDTGLCLHFMYMTFGTALRVSLRMNEIAGRILFSDHRYDAIWQEGQASIKQMDEPFMIEFISTVGPHATAVTLAYISVSQKECLPLPKCDFTEQDNCGYESDPPYAWKNGRHQTTLPGGVPFADHTSEDLYGHFMYTAGSGKNSLTSPVKQQSPDQGSCTYFWYIIDGPDYGTLSVKMKREGSKRARNLWKSDGLVRNQWLQGRVDIPKDTDKYRLVFEADLTVADLVALDDIETVSGACPQAGTCDFDTDMCGYTTHTYNTDTEEVHTEVRWLRLVSSVPMSMYGPFKDHTTVEGKGGYAFSDVSSRVSHSLDEITRMVSPVLPPTKEQCLVFWFYFTGDGDGNLIAKVGERTVFNETSKDKEWRKSTPFQYSSDVSYQITFESVRRSHADATMAVDDISVTDGACDSEEPVEPPKTPDEPPKTPDEPPKTPDEPPKTPDCGTKCDHWKSCKRLSNNDIKCNCIDGYEGDKCDKRIASDEPPPPKEQPSTPKEKPSKDYPRQPDVEVLQPDEEESKPSDSHDAHSQTSGSRSSKDLTVAVEIIASIVVVAVLVLIVFVVLVRTNRVRAPLSLQRMVPYLRTPERPSYPNVVTFSNSGEGGITNPVYGDYEQGESDI